MSDAIKFEPMEGVDVPESPEERCEMLAKMAREGEYAAIVFDVMEGKAWKCWSPDCEPGSNTIADAWCQYFAEAGRSEEVEVFTRTGDRYGVAFESRATYMAYGMEVYPL